MCFIAAFLPSWPLWVILLVGIVLTLAALMFVIGPLLLLVTVPLPSHQFISFAPLEPDAQISLHPFLQDAIRQGYAFIGHFTNGQQGMGRSIHNFALSPDGLVLLRIERSGVGLLYCSLVTRYSGERWLITMSTGGASPDFSGLDLPEILPDVTFPVLLEGHLTRVQSAGENPIPFRAECLLADLMQRERQRVDRMVDLGFARYKSDDRSRYKYTFKAALRFAARPFVGWARTIQSVKLAQKMTKQAQWGLGKQTPH